MEGKEITGLTKVDRETSDQTFICIVDHEKGVLLNE